MKHCIENLDLSKNFQAHEKKLWISFMLKNEIFFLLSVCFPVDTKRVTHKRHFAQL